MENWARATACRNFEGKQYFEMGPQVMQIITRSVHANQGQAWRIALDVSKANHLHPSAPFALYRYLLPDALVLPFGPQIQGFSLPL